MLVFLLLWLYVCGITAMFLFAYPASPLSSGLNVDDLRQRTIKFFGPGTEYDTPLNNPYREKGGIVLIIFFNLSFTVAWKCLSGMQKWIGIVDLCAILLCSGKAHVLRCPSTDRGDMGVLRASWRMWTQAKRRQVNLQHVYPRNKNHLIGHN